ncbi:TPA: bacterial Ig-like domain-containing protein [Enterococcus faecalis]|uniref:bacterial Ig-like domain-containing protein n=1 Tax=Enterococcus faecalis TaxID=1351 RepID=UPI001CB67096|nr:bacterial Ig-like domain-containing protein [Enterococcus faecalis]HBI3769146.1 bacterial Ig-like domain-containing protein [Enterococcus faecalis]
MKKFLFIVVLFSLFLYINQERIAFAEIENVQAKEQIDNNTSNETEFQSSLSNPELLFQKPKLRLIAPYYIMAGDPFEDSYPFLGGTDENGNELDFSKIKVRKYTPNIYGYEYIYGEGAVGQHVEIYRTARDNRKVQLKNITLWQNDRWDLGRVIETVTDQDGYPIKPEEIEHVWIDGKQGVREIDTSKQGKYSVRIAVSNPNTRPLVEDVCVVTVREDKTKAELKDDELYVGEKWELGRVFKNVTDGYGNLINPEQVTGVWIDGKANNREIDTSKPGKHKVFIGIKNPLGKLITSETVTVTVKKEDKTSLKTKDSTLYAGEKWEPKDNFVSATDEDGKSIPWEDSRITRNGANIDTSKPGVHKIKYTFKGKVKDVDSEFTVTVKEDKTSLKTKDSTLYTGEKWEPKDNFVSATDEDGKSIPWEDSRITRNGANIDTSKPGVHKIKYTFKGKVKNVNSEFTVTVKEEPFIIKKVPQFDFDDYILGSTNKSVANNKETPIIELETPSIVGKDWQLQVELSPFVDKKNEKNVLKGVSLFIPKGKLESDLETEEPNQYECKLEANGKASILMEGMKTKGKGRWKNKLATKEITLSIPPENKKGNYESTLHWTLLDVPG